MIVLGIDSGSLTTDAVLLVDGVVRASVIVLTGASNKKAAEKARQEVISLAGIESQDVARTVATGYGRDAIEFADAKVTEITCHAIGARRLFPEVRTVVDIGGQDSKVIRIDDTGRVLNFAMNDKCAAGTGRGMEVLADLLGVSINEVGESSFKVKEEPRAVSSTCVVYAKSEATGLLRKGWSTEEVLASYCRAMAERIYALIERVGVVPRFAVTGGMAKNRGVIDRLMPMVGLERMTTGWDTQIAGALGAALFGYALCQKGKGRKK